MLRHKHELKLLRIFQMNSFICNFKFDFRIMVVLCICVSSNVSLNSPSGLIVHEGAAVYSVFLRWRAVNLHWDVQSYNKAKDMEEASAGHSSLAPRTLWLPLVSFGPNGSLQATQLESQSWTRLCLASFCPRLLPRTNTGQENESGEVVIRVTSV